MKKNKNVIDQEMQEALDRRGHLPGQGKISLHEDAELYESIFQILDHKPEIHFGDDFTKTIITVARRRKKIRDIFWKVVLYTNVSLLFILVSMLTVLAMDAEIFWKMLESMKYNAGYLLFGGIVFALIQLLDRILVKKNLPDTGT